MTLEMINARMELKELVDTFSNLADVKPWLRLSLPRSTPARQFIISTDSIM